MLNRPLRKGFGQQFRDRLLKPLNIHRLILLPKPAGQFRRRRDDIRRFGGAGVQGVNRSVVSHYHTDGRADPGPDNVQRFSPDEQVGETAFRAFVTAAAVGGVEHRAVWQRDWIKFHNKYTPKFVPSHLILLRVG